MGCSLADHFPLMDSFGVRSVKIDWLLCQSAMMFMLISLAGYCCCGERKLRDVFFSFVVRWSQSLKLSKILRFFGMLLHLDLL